MSRIAYVNGRYLTHRAAGVSIEDRAFLFADGIYEVIEVFGGALIDEERHLERLQRSARELALGLPGLPAIRLVLRQLIARNRVSFGHVYLQITRGAARRDHVFPASSTPPGFVAFARAADPAAAQAKALNGIKLISLPDIRWRRPDIKSTSLLPNVLARQQAKERDAYEAWLVDDAGHVTEGSASNAWIVDASGKILTHPADAKILRGVTRARLIEIIGALNLSFEERPFTLVEAKMAREAFITGATTLVMPAVSLDGAPIGEGRPGAVALKLRALFHDFAIASR